MDFAIDANVLFSALIKDSITAELLLEYRGRLFAPEYIFEEFSEHEKEILEKTKKEEFDEIFEILKQIIPVVPKEEFEGFLEEAQAISLDPGEAEKAG